MQTLLEVRPQMPERVRLIQHIGDLLYQLRVLPTSNFQLPQDNFKAVAQDVVLVLELGECRSAGERAAHGRRCCAHDGGGTRERRRTLGSNPKGSHIATKHWPHIRNNKRAHVVGRDWICHTRSTLQFTDRWTLAKQTRHRLFRSLKFETHANTVDVSAHHCV